MKRTIIATVAMMKTRLIVVLLMLALLSVSVLTGCTEDPPHTDPTIPSAAPREYKAVEPVGDVPEGFRHIIQDNLFNGITAFGDRLLKAETIEMDDENRTKTHRIQMMDLHGTPLASYTCSTHYAYHIKTPTATEDGGFLFVLGFSDYAYDQNTWASDEGFASRIVKCDKNGAVQFDTALDGIEGYALQYCFEKGDNFYFFGTLETPETKKRGIGSPSDIYMMIMDKNGTVLKSETIAGSDYDELNAAEISGDFFVLSISAQSDDGDFAGSDSKGYLVDWVFTVDGNLQITEQKKATGRDYFDKEIGEKDGAPIYPSDVLFEHFDAGDPIAFLDYGDFYLIVSRNITGMYEHTPGFINSIWYYRETVYSAYDNNDKLLFRTAVDSSPDYDALVASLER